MAGDQKDRKSTPDRKKLDRDPWDTDDEEALKDDSVVASYNENSFFLRSSDRRGFSATEATRYPPHIIGMVDEFVQKRETPYRSRADFFRDAAIHRLVKVRAMYKLGTLDRTFSALFNFDLMLQNEELEIKHKEHIERLRAIIRNYISMGKGGEKEARKVLIKALMHIEAMPDGFLKDLYVEPLIKEYGHLLKDDDIKEIKKSAQDG